MTSNTHQLSIASRLAMLKSITKNYSKVSVNYSFCFKYSTILLDRKQKPNELIFVWMDLMTAVTLITSPMLKYVFYYFFFFIYIKSIKYFFSCKSVSFGTFLFLFLNLDFCLFLLLKMHSRPYNVSISLTEKCLHFPFWAWDWIAMKSLEFRLWAYDGIQFVWMPTTTTIKYYPISGHTTDIRIWTQVMVHILKCGCIQSRCSNEI